jgi:hypothetical protein
MNLEEGKQNGYARRVREMYKNDTRESIVGGDQWKYTALLRYCLRTYLRTANAHCLSVAQKCRQSPV